MQTDSQPQWVRKTYTQTLTFLLLIDGLAISASVITFIKAHPTFFNGLIDMILFVTVCMFCFLLWKAYRAAFRLLPAQESEARLSTQQSLPEALSLLVVAGAGCTIMGLVFGIFLGKSFLR